MAKPTTTRARKQGKAKGPKIPDGFEACGWQGYGFGAAYEDAGCVHGKASDLDNCVGHLVVIGEEDCPNCQGKGIVPIGQPMRGAMALHRQRECRDLCSDIMDGMDTDDQKEWGGELCKRIEALFRLVRKLEEGDSPASARGSIPLRTPRAGGSE